MSKPVLSISEWKQSDIRFMQPKTNDKKGKSINIISTQLNSSLRISTPLLMTWGIADFINEDGNSDGKFNISLNFPNEEYRNKATDEFLAKLKDFEEILLEEAVKHSELWWGGDKLEKAVLKHTYFPFVKYSQNKETNKIDMSKPPSIRAKVPKYQEKWAVEIYDTKQNLIFPSSDEYANPSDFVPKLSMVACVIQCSGIWIGGKGWGVTWKLAQAVVKPKEIIQITGKCHVQLSDDDLKTFDNQEMTENMQESYEPVSETLVQDSDDEAEIVAPPVAVKKVVVKSNAKPVEIAPEIIAPVVEENSVVVSETIATENISIQIEENSAVAVETAPPEAKAAPKKVVKKVIKK